MAEEVKDEELKQEFEAKGTVGIAEKFKIPPELYQENRAKLVARFKALADVPTENAVALLAGGKSSDAMRYDTDHEDLFHQESFFLYLFGLAEPDALGLVDLETGESVLFLPRQGDTYAMWCGKPRPLHEYAKQYGVTEARYADEILAVLNERGTQTIHTLYGLNTDSGSYTVTEAQFEGRDKFTVNNAVLHRELVECRVIKTERELAVLKYICEVSAQAHLYVMREVRPGMMEYQLESLFRHYTQMYGGSRYLAYTCICGSGKNGSILHYGHAGAPNDKKIGEDDMCLLDMGADYQGYCSDITCSFPANGRFNDKHKIVFNAVVAAQQAVYDRLRPGVLWSDMHRAAEAAIIEHLVAAEIIIPHGKITAELQELHIGAAFMPHGLGHFMGLDTHDVGGYPDGVERLPEPGVCCLRTNRVMVKNMVVTVEPGCYFIEFLLENLLKDEKTCPHLNWDKIQDEGWLAFGGVRLEDDIIITEDGYVNMSASCPRSVEDVERVMSESNNK